MIAAPEIAARETAAGPTAPETFVPAPPSRSAESVPEPGGADGADDHPKGKQYGAAVRQTLLFHKARAPGILIKMARARLRHNVGPSIFCLFAMHRRPAASWRDYRNYYNGHIQVLRIVNGTSKREQDARDKVAFTSILQRAGVAIAPIAATAGGRLPQGDGAPALSDRGQLLEFVESGAMPSPAFVKPSDGAMGKGAFKARREGDGWVVGDERLSAAGLVERLWLADGCNIIQPVLRTHGALADLGGDFGLSTVRVVTALTETGPELVFALMKLLQKPSTVDNFVGGANGVLLAPIDLATGRFRPAIGFHPQHHLMQERHDRHPRLGGVVAGRAVPLFDEMAAVARSVADALPAHRMVGMDVALTDEGAKVVDINLAWGCLLPQITMERGIADLYREWVPRLALEPAKRRQALLELDRLGKR